MDTPGTLGDVWGSEPQPQSTSMLSLDYYRNKAREFQVVMDALDRSYWAASGALGTGALDATTTQSLEDALADFESRRTTIRLTAEAINLGAATINSAGGTFPKLSIPGTLNAGPILVGAAMVGAIGTAAALIVWGSKWINGVNERLRRAQVLEAATPQQRERIVESIAQSDNAVQVAESSVLASVAPIVKWVAIGVGAFLLYRAYTGSRRA